jgi:hypothetical protein
MKKLRRLFVSLILIIGLFAGVPQKINAADVTKYKILNIAPDAACLEVKCLPGKDNYWVAASKNFILPKNCTLYVYYGTENSAVKINPSKKGDVVAWNKSGKDRSFKKGSLIAAPPAKAGQYIYYRFVQGTSFKGVSVQNNPNIPSGTPVSKWVADGKVPGAVKDKNNSTDKATTNQVIAPDSTCLEVKYLPGEDSYGNDYWIVTSKAFKIPKNCTLYVYYGPEASADKIDVSKQGDTVMSNDSDGEITIRQGNKLGAPPAQAGQYIYYRFVQGTNFNGQSVQGNPQIPSGTPVSKWVADGIVTDK